MTSKEAIQDAKDSLSNDELTKLRVSRTEWEDVVDYLAGIGIYPDNDPRTKLKIKV